MTAIRAAFVDCQPVRTRSVWKLVFEIPIADVESALGVLGIPDPATERWCGIAVLNDSAAGTQPPLPARSSADFGGAGNHPEAGSGAAGRPAQHPLVRQAGMLCKDPRFQEWVRNEEMGDGYPAVPTPELAAALLRDHCGIASRRELATNPDAAAKFEQLIARYRQDTGQIAEKRS